MTPEQSMQIYLAECSLHAGVLDEGLVDARTRLPLSSGIPLEKEMLRILDQIAYRFAKQHDPYVKAYFQHLVDNGKKPLQALCAVMRKLLHAIHGMLKHDKPFDNTRFYAIPA